MWHISPIMIIAADGYYITLHPKEQQPPGKILAPERGEDSGDCGQGGADRHGGGAGRIAVGGGPAGRREAHGAERSLE